MPDDYVQVAPDSTGKKIRSRQRTVGANTIEEQYLIVQPHDRVPISRTWFSTLRIPSQTSTSYTIFTVFNSGSDAVSVRRLSVEASTATAHAALSPYVRLYRTTSTAPTNGSAVTGVQQDTSDATIAGVTVLQSASADGTYSAITATASGSAAWVQVLPRYHTLTGFSPPPVMNCIPDDSTLNSEDPLILRQNQGLMLRVESSSAPAASGIWQLFVKTVLTEFTQP